jgi:hypothetical protein
MKSDFRIEAGIWWFIRPYAGGAAGFVPESTAADRDKSNGARPFVATTAGFTASALTFSRAMTARAADFKT